MKSLWNTKEAKKCGDDPLAQRVYTSRLIGAEPDLVLHGGGNTSVKASVRNIFGDDEEILYVKGSGWNLETIEREGFAPVRLDVLRRMAELPELSDTDMVSMQRSAMIDPNAPAPSVEAILHAIIPFRFVDHTHADAVVTLTNSPNGMERIVEIYGERVFVVPYVMPGFVLAKEIYEMSRDANWQEIEAMILLGHGVFTFHDDARASYERMIEIVTAAENYLEKHARIDRGKKNTAAPPPEIDLTGLASLRREISECAGTALTARLDSGPAAVHFSLRNDVRDIATRGPLTPDHIIRTRRSALIVGPDIVADVLAWAEDYRGYFDRNTNGELTCLDPAPRWAVWRGMGTIALGPGDRAAGIVADIVAHTVTAIERAEALGGWRALDEADLFDVEYWELEQAKLAGAGEREVLEGHVALVTGAASGIGRSCVEQLLALGACVGALDVNPEIQHRFPQTGVIGIECDVTDPDDVAGAVDEVVYRFGGLDILVSNAGIFPTSETIAEMDAENWDRSLSVNLSGHRNILQKCLPYLELGIDPAVVMVGSKNVAAPGPGVGAYSVAKAGLTQLARIAALEFAPLGIRVNVIHPSDVFDTGIWSDEVLESRAAQYGMTVEEYRTRNLLGVEIESSDVAALVGAMAGPLFSRTTGAQVSIDGGNERTI
ncbi:MAG: bifunctional aldolase/short-chain dehydrogenase [Candidatus Krumholzibacteriota bacterium]|nr:bifunctional aldolase/short-chain dehydrogenase [Candidatus Krumholzibacteriota bacterium]